MKLVLNLSLFLFVLATLEDKSFSLTQYQIKRICKNERSQSTCIKILRQKKINLEKGQAIEIPVVPFNKWRFKFQILIQKD